MLPTRAADDEPVSAKANRRLHLPSPPVLRCHPGGNVVGMAVKKQSVALDEEVLRAAQRSAARAHTSLSAWLNRAAARALRIEQGLAAVSDWENEHGAPTPLELRRADRALAPVLASQPKRSRAARRR